MTLVYDRAVEGARTHAFVIGCGRFPHYTSDINRNSTVAGAREIVDFLRRHEDKLIAPLATVEVLLSDPAVASGEDVLGLAKSPHDPRNDDNVSPAMLDEARIAGNQWIGRCRSGDTMLFYMSSHGVVERDPSALGLFEDFYSIPAAHFIQAINVSRLAATLPTTGAGACWIFLDACQEVVQELIQQPDGSGALLLLTPTITQLAQARARSVALAGSRFGGAAWAPTDGRPPFFTQALLCAMSTCAVAQIPDIGWGVTGQRLLFDLSKVANAALDITSLETESLTPFNQESVLLRIDVPAIPVVVRTEIEAHMGAAETMVVTDGAGREIVKPANERKWHFPIPADGARYTITSQFKPGGPIYPDHVFNADPAAQIIRLRR